MLAIILCGGLGTRLRSVVNDLPKPMASINGKPFLHYLVNYLANQGIRKVILSVGYKASIIQDYFKHSYNGVSIEYAIEEVPLGTGGAVKHALALVESEDPIFLVNGDTLSCINYKQMLAFHAKNKSSITLCGTFIEKPDRYETLKYSNDSNLIAFSARSPSALNAYINTGTYVFSKNIVLDQDILSEKFSFENDFLMPNIQQLRPKVFLSKAFFLDIGVPEDYLASQELLKEQGLN